MVRVSWLFWGISDKISLMRKLENKSSLRHLPRESVFPEDLIGSKSTFKTYSLVKYGMRKISLKLDLFSSLLRRPILSDSLKVFSGLLQKKFDLKRTYW